MSSDGYDAMLDAGDHLLKAEALYATSGPSPDVTALALLSIANSLHVLAAYVDMRED